LGQDATPRLTRVGIANVIDDRKRTLQVRPRPSRGGPRQERKDPSAIKPNEPDLVGKEYR